MIHFVVCSITFLQLYIPLVQEGNRRGYPSIFHLRENSKEYANPYSKKNYNLLQHMMSRTLSRHLKTRWARERWARERWAREHIINTERRESGCCWRGSETACLVLWTGTRSGFWWSGFRNRSGFVRAVAYRTEGKLTDPSKGNLAGYLVAMQWLDKRLKERKRGT